MNDNLNVLINRLNNYNTAHGWHFIASLFTGGLWVIMWILFTLSNAIERVKIGRRIKKLLASQR